MIRKRFIKLLERAQFWLQTTSKIAEYEGIALAGLRRRSDHFRVTLLGALQLLQTLDPRRFTRIQREIVWVVNCTLACPGAEYHGETRTCRVNFEEPTPDSDPEFSIGWWARTLVHEATHGMIEQRGIPYEGTLRSRIERLCVTEENRFLKRLSAARPELAERLNRIYSEADWQFAWGATRRELATSLIHRLRNR